MANIEDVYLFWDNSNIFLGAQTTAKRLTPRVKEYMVRVYFPHLVRLILGKRRLCGAFCGGSIPPASDEVWNYIEKQLGVKPILYSRASRPDGTSFEQGVDERIHLAMLQTITDVDPPGVIALLTGDGAEAIDSPATSFLKNLERGKKFGWDIEVYSWDSAMNRAMRNYVEANGKYQKLDDDFYSLTFVPAHDGGVERRVRPLFGEAKTLL